LGARALASHQQLPGSSRKSQTELHSRWELDSGMHRSEPGFQAGQAAGPIQKPAMDKGSKSLTIPQL